MPDVTCTHCNICTEMVVWHFLVLLHFYRISTACKLHSTKHQLLSFRVGIIVATFIVRIFSRVFSFINCFWILFNLSRCSCSKRYTKWCFNVSDTGDFKRMPAAVDQWPPSIQHTKNSTIVKHISMLFAAISQAKSHSDVGLLFGQTITIDSNNAWISKSILTNCSLSFCLRFWTCSHLSSLSQTKNWRRRTFNYFK